MASKVSHCIRGEAGRSWKEAQIVASGKHVGMKCVYQARIDTLIYFYMFVLLCVCVLFPCTRIFQMMLIKQQIKHALIYYEMLLTHFTFIII